MSLELTCTSYCHGADPQKFNVPQPKPLLLPLPTPPTLGSIDILKYYFKHSGHRAKLHVYFS